MPLTDETVGQIGLCSVDVRDLLQRIKGGHEAQANVDAAWQVFSLAEHEHLRSLHADLLCLPNEARPIVAATIARLEGSDPADRLERYRTAERYTLSKAAADALGRYLADPDLSGMEAATMNRVRAIAHDDERVRRAALSHLKRRKDPKTAEALLEIVLAEYPDNSAKKAKQRGAAITMIRVLAWLPFVGSSWLFGQFDLLLAFLCLIGGSYLARALESRFQLGSNRLVAEARGEILSCIADIEPKSPTAFLDKLPELQAILSGLDESDATKRAARRLIERIEATSSEVRDLPLGAARSEVSPGALPLPVRANS
jgi:hypothetical protein